MDGLGFEFSGFSVSIVQNYFLRAALVLHKQLGTLKVHMSQILNPAVM